MTEKKELTLNEVISSKFYGLGLFVIALYYCYRMSMLLVLDRMLIPSSIDFILVYLSLILVGIILILISVYVFNGGLYD